MNLVPIVEKVNLMVHTNFKIIIVIIMGFALNVTSPPISANPPSPLGDMTLHVIPQAHIDIAWWWRYDAETIHVITKRTLETAFQNMELYPDYTFTFLQVPAIAPLEKLYPDLFYKLQYYIHNSEALGERIWNPLASGHGRLEIAGGLWLEPDACVPCGESLVRQCLYGKRYFKYKFGIDVRTGWFQDAWTHPWTYPQILKKSGIDSYMFKRGEGGNDEKMFWWQSADGSRVFAYKPGMYGENLPAQDQLDNRLLEVNKKYGVKDDIILVGVGNHGGGPLRTDVERMKQTIADRERKTMAEKPAKIEFSTPTKFLNAVGEKQNNFPVVNYEITPTIRGAYTTVGEIKKGNRLCENLLLSLEKYSSIADALGKVSYPRKDLTEAWEKMMLNQFHDTISGTDIPPATDDALELYGEVLETGEKKLHCALKSISSNINTQGEGIPLIVFNPLAYTRTDLVETELKIEDSTHSIELRDVQGKRIPFQLISQKSENRIPLLKVIFIAENVPSLGYKMYRVIPGSFTPHYASVLKAAKHEMENEFFKIQIDPVTGCLKSVIDKKNGREVLDNTGKGNLIQIIEDFGDSEGFLKSADGARDPHHKWTGKSWNVDSNPLIDVLEQGPVRATVQIKKKFGLARFTQNIILYSGIPKIDFDLIIAWNGKDKMIKVSFPLSISSPEATYEIPYGTINRPSIGEEHTAQKWVDISDNNYGVSLLNDSRYGYDVKDNVIRLSVLRSPSGPAFASDEKGFHVVRYSLFPHKSSWQEAQVMQMGYNLNNLLIAFQATVHKGNYPASYSFLKIEPENLILEVLKKTEDSNDLMVRFYETEGKSCTAKLTFSDPLTFDAVHKTDLIENGLEDIKTDGKSFQVPVGAYSIESFKLIKDE